MWNMLYPDPYAWISSLRQTFQWGRICDAARVGSNKEPSWLGSESQPDDALQTNLIPSQGWNWCLIPAHFSTYGLICCLFVEISSLNINIGDLRQTAYSSYNTPRRPVSEIWSVLNSSLVLQTKPNFSEDNSSGWSRCQHSAAYVSSPFPSFSPRHLDTEAFSGLPSGRTGLVCPSRSWMITSSTLIPGWETPDLAGQSATPTPGWRTKPTPGELVMTSKALGRLPIGGRTGRWGIETDATKNVFKIETPGLRLV